MTRAILRGYELAEPGQTHCGPDAGQRLPRLRQPGHGRGFSHSAHGPEETRPRVLGALDDLLRNWPADRQAEMKERPE